MGLTPGTRLGRWLKPNPPVLFCAGLMEIGNPVCAVRMPLHCQPPRTAFIGRFQSAPNCLPFPKGDRKSTRLNSSHQIISYAVFCLKTKKHTSELQSPDHLVCPLLLEKHITRAIDRASGPSPILA